MWFLDVFFRFFGRLWLVKFFRWERGEGSDGWFFVGDKFGFFFSIGIFFFGCGEFRMVLMEKGKVLLFVFLLFC